MLIETINKLTSSWSEPIIIVSGKGEIITANASFYTLIGMSGQDICRQNIIDHVNDSAGKVTQYLLSSSRSSYPIPGALNLLRNDGKSIACRCSGHLIQQGTKEVPSLIFIRFEYKSSVSNKFIALNRTMEELQSSNHKLKYQAEVLKKEILQRHKAEEDLRESSTRLQLSLRASNVGLWDWSLITNEVYFSPEWKNQIGFEDRELANDYEEWESRLHPEDRDTVLLELKSYMEGRKQDYAPEFRLRHKDGSYRWIYASGDMLLDEKGEPDRMMGCHIDITDRKIAEAALLENEEYLRLAQETAQIGSWRWDLSTDELTWSKEVFDIFGFDTDVTPLFKDFMNSVHKNDKEFVTGAIERTLAEKEPYDIEYRIIRPSDNVERIVHAKGRAFYNDKGDSTGMMGMVFDVTDSRKLDEELQRSHKLESVGVLAGGIAHDFNNLLTAILNNLHLAESKIDNDSDAYRLLEKIKKSISLAASLTQQLITFSQGGEPVKEVASPVEIIKENAEFTLRGSNVGCEYDFPANLWSLEIDKGQISQVLQNIIFNAEQAMPDGGIIRITAENKSISSSENGPVKKGRYIKLTFADQGVGISGEDLQKIFDPFFTTKKTGRGLGLAVTHSIIKRHEGHISVESQSGGGTIFSIYLPASEEEIIKKQCSEEVPFEGEGRILIMDDDEMIIDSVSQILSLAGYYVETAKDGNEAVVLCQRAKELGLPFKLAILDLTIPGGMGGRDTIKKLHEIDPDIKGIVSSGYSTDPIMSDYEDYGFNGVVIKPYKVEELQKVVCRVMGS